MAVALLNPSAPLSCRSMLAITWRLDDGNNGG
jgi:hypothetical protein